MALKVELKPQERVIIGTAVIRNGETRSRLYIEGVAPILREKDILTPDTANSPAKLIYLSIQLMYLAQDTAKQHEVYFSLVHDFIRAAPSATALISDINNLILSGDLYKALKTAKRLITYEQELISHAERSQCLRESLPGNPVPTGA